MHGGYANFYSRPCGRGDEADVCGRNAVIISTHAPAGGATYKVSTRVLTVRCISTHAPAGGATWMIRSYKGGGLIFLLTPLREGRQEQSKDAARYATFLLTPLREGRQMLMFVPNGSMLFLLTPLREGRPDPDAGVEHLLPISTHAPAGGATWSMP